jgi:hypothetical protein
LAAVAVLEGLDLPMRSMKLFRERVGLVVD